MADLKAFAEQLVNLSVKEVNELATILKDEYGIEPAAAAVAVAAPADIFTGTHRKLPHRELGIAAANINHRTPFSKGRDIDFKTVGKRHKLAIGRHFKFGAVFGAI